MNFFTTNLGNPVHLGEVIKSGRLSEGKHVDLFEQTLKEKFGIHHLVTVNSGTAALHLALVAAGVKPGDEVILSAQTFIASGLAILYCGAIPVFVDIDYSGNIKAGLIERFITNKTKAILVVHWGGLPADLEEINRIASEYNLKVIEDAAHAIGAHYKNIPIGNYSDFTCFSFQAIKNVTTGDGGAIAFTNPAHERTLKKLRWFGIDRENDLPGPLGEREYNLEQLGYKYHLNNVGAAIGLDSLSQWNRRDARRRDIRKFYNDELRGVPGIQFPYVEYLHGHGNWLYTMEVENRLGFIEKLKSKDIPSSIVHTGIHKNRIFAGCTRSELIRQKEWDWKQINIPFHADLLDGDVQLIVKTIKEGW